jgi:hypothetical protein
MNEPIFRYGDIKRTMHDVVCKLEAAGYPEEAKAMASLTHIIAHRVQEIDISNKWGVEYLIEYFEHQGSLIKYINDGESKIKSQE